MHRSEREAERVLGARADAPATRLPAETTVVFLHIGKTAGQTLSRILRRNVAADRRVRIPNPDGAKGFVTDAPIRTFASWPPARRAHVRLVMSHMVLGIHEHVPGPVTYMTLLREPVARIVSSYGMARRLPTHRLHEAVAGGMSLEEYALGGHALETDNAQTRALAGDVSTPFGACTYELLARAKANLERQVSLAGLTEAFDEHLVVMRELYGYRRLAYVRANVGRSGGARRGADAAVLERIAEANRLDVELYEHVRARFEAQAAAIPDFAGKLERLRARNRLYQPLGHVTYTLPRRAYATVRRTGW